MPTAVLLRMAVYCPDGPIVLERRLLTYLGFD